MTSWIFYLTTVFDVGNMLEAHSRNSNNIRELQCADCWESLDCSQSNVQAAEHAQDHLNWDSGQPLYHCIPCQLLLLRRADLEDYLEFYGQTYSLPPPLQLSHIMAAYGYDQRGDTMIYEANYLKEEEQEG
jgi:hypothetical protein